MKVLFINNDGGGFASHVEVPAGTTVTDFFKQHLAGQSTESFLLRVNRLPVAAEQVLQDGDRISATPLKIAGA